MTREEAKAVLYEWQEMMVRNGVPLDTSKVQALRVAIEALSKPNYETDTEVRLAVTDRNKDKVVLWDAFGEVEYYPNGEINCVKCPHYYETEDDTGVHSHCGSHGRLIDAYALMRQWNDYLEMAVGNFPITPADITQIIKDAPTVQADRPHGEWLKVDTYFEAFNETVTNYKCSVCEHEPYFGGGISKLHFCPNCGADNRGKQNV